MNFERAFLDGFIKAAADPKPTLQGITPKAAPATPKPLGTPNRGTMMQNPAPALPVTPQPAATSNIGMNAVTPAQPAKPIPAPMPQSWNNPASFAGGTNNPFTQQKTQAQPQPRVQPAPAAPKPQISINPAEPNADQTGAGYYAAQMQDPNVLTPSTRNSFFGLPADPVSTYSPANLGLARSNQQAAADLGNGVNDQGEASASRMADAQSTWRDPGAVGSEAAGFDPSAFNEMNAANQPTAKDHRQIQSAFYKAMGSGEAMPEGFMRGANNQAVEIPQAAYSNPDPAGRGAQLDQEIRQAAMPQKPAATTNYEASQWKPTPGYSKI